MADKITRNLPGGTVCMCHDSYQHTDAEFMISDTVILVVQSFDMEKKQIYGKSSPDGKESNSRCGHSASFSNRIPIRLTFPFGSVK
jgi:hypothetical protein